MTALSPDHVYRGFWVNHAKGEVLGATITLSTGNSNVLVAGMALLISLAGEHLWGIVSFAYYTLRTSNAPRDRLFYQRQLLLRNTASPGSMILRISTLYLDSRRHVKDPLRRLVPTILLAMTCGAIIVFASTLSSQIMESSDIEVLAQSQSCGFADPAGDLWDSYMVTAASQGLRYSRSCYNKSTAYPAGQLYVTSGIPFETVYVPCPLEGLCILSENSAIRMDTGRLNSNTIFGINAKPSETVDLRKITTCAPLNLTRYEKIVDMDDAHTRWKWDRAPLPGEQMLTWDLGRHIDGSVLRPLFNESWFMDLLSLHTNTDYIPNIISHYAPDLGAESNWDAVAPFARKDADTTIVLIGLGVTTYNSPVDDPVFAAHQNASYTMPDGSFTDFKVGFKSDKLTGAIGCFEQYQICIPDGTCTTPLGISETVTQISELGLSGLQNATVTALTYTAFNAAFDVGVVGGLPIADRLVASKTGAVWPFALPSNQWEIEVKAWEAMVLTSFQKLSSDVALGSGVSGSKYASMPLLPAGPFESVVCRSQKMIAPAGFSNVSLFGLAFTVVVCFLITMTNLFLTGTLRRWARITAKRSSVLEQWDDDDMLQVQSQLLGTRGVEDWSRKVRRRSMVTGGTTVVDVAPSPEQYTLLTYSHDISKSVSEAEITTNEITLR